MTQGNRAARVFLMAGLTVPAGIDARQPWVSTTVQQRAVGPHGQVKPPALVRQFGAALGGRRNECSESRSRQSEH